LAGGEKQSKIVVWCFAIITAAVEHVLIEIVAGTFEDVVVNDVAELGRETKKR